VGRDCADSENGSRLASMMAGPQGNYSEGSSLYDERWMTTRRESSFRERERDPPNINREFMNT
jgi:hypothetical protein